MRNPTGVIGMARHEETTAPNRLEGGGMSYLRFGG